MFLKVYFCTSILSIIKDYEFGRNLRGTKYEGVNFEIEEVLKVILIHNQTKKVK